MSSSSYVSNLLRLLYLRTFFTCLVFDELDILGADIILNFKLFPY